jgi:hypothetical protein
MPAADANSSADGSFGFTVKASLDNLGAGLSTGTVVWITETAVNDEPKAEAYTINPGVAEDAGELTIPFATLTANDGKGAVNEGSQTLAVATGTPVTGVGRVEEPAECISGLVLQGLKKPHECTAFGTRCTPETPLGAPMVSSEGACAAYYLYGRRHERIHAKLPDPAAR